MHLGVSLPFNPCQCASHYKLYSRPRCIVLNLCFLFLTGISQSLGFERVTDMPPASTSRCSPAAHELEKALVRIMYLPFTLRRICHALRSSCAERDSNFEIWLTKTAVMKRCDRIAEIQEDFRRLANVETGE